MHCEVAQRPADGRKGDRPLGVTVGAAQPKVGLVAAAQHDVAGLHANPGLMAVMGPLLGGAKVDNLAIKLSPDVATAEKVRRIVESVDPDQLPRPWIADDLAKRLKFADCMPEEIAVDVASVRVRDLAGIRRAAGEPVDGVVSAGP